MKRRHVVRLALPLLVLGALSAPPAGPAEAAPVATASHGSSSPAGTPWRLAEATPVARPTTTVAPSAAPKPGSVTLSVASPAPAYWGDQVDLTATASPTLGAGGLMSFFDGKVLLGSSVVDGTGTAYRSTSALVPARHALTASYTKSGKTTTSPVAYVTIAKRPLWLYPEAPYWNRPVGAANPAFHTALYPSQPAGGLVNGDSLSSAVAGKPKFTTSAALRSTPSVYPVTLSGLTSLNYLLTFKPSAIAVYSRDIGVGQQAPDITGKDQSGATFSVSSQQGRMVLLDLSTIWCGPSAFMASQVNDVRAALNAQGIPFTYVPIQLEGSTPGVAATQQNALAFANHYKLSGVHVLHPDGVGPQAGKPLPALLDAFYALGNVPSGLQPAFPTLVLLDKSGIVRWTNIGSVDKADLVPQIASLSPDSGVQLTATPAVRSADTDPSFAFTATYGDPTSCRLDGGAWAPCTSPTQLSSVSDGPHVFEISSGRPDTAVFAWTVDTSAPETTIDSVPSDGDPTFTFSSSDASATFTCWIDAGTPYDCQSPDYEFDLAAGQHTFHVAATNDLGTTDPTPATSDFTTQPLPLITSGATPALPTDSDDVTVSFTLVDGTSSAPIVGETVYLYSSELGYSDALVTDGNGTVSFDAGAHAVGTYSTYLYYLGDADHGAATATLTYDVS